MTRRPIRRPAEAYDVLIAACLTGAAICIALLVMTYAWGMS